jgi:hypothetical protein
MSSSQGLEGSKLSWAERRQECQKRTLAVGRGKKGKVDWGTEWGTLGPWQPEQESAPPDAGTDGLQPMGAKMGVCRS